MVLNLTKDIIPNQLGYGALRGSSVDSEKMELWEMSGNFTFLEVSHVGELLPGCIPFVHAFQGKITCANVLSDLYKVSQIF